MNYPTLAEATHYLHEHIPQSAAMEVTVHHLGEDAVKLAAPLAPNINHRHTVFGGSLSSTGILSAWAYLHFRLRTAIVEPCRVVISRSETAYNKPVDEDFVAICPAPTSESWEKFIGAVKRHGKGRIALSAFVYAESDRQNPLALFTGTFVAIIQKPDTNV